MEEAIPIKKRDVAVDFVKFIATLLVLNSHMGKCYGSYSFLATGGGIGDALFFFISGFTLFMGKKTDFINWYKKRIGRIYPAVLSVGLMASVFWREQNSFIEVMTAEKYWFLQCILVCYLLLYPIIKYKWKLNMCILVSIGAVLISYFTVFDFQGQMFYGVNNYFRWIFYFTIMLMGGYLCLKSNKVVYKKWNIPAIFICIITWYGINYIAKGGSLSLLSMIPLVGICYLVYAIGKSPWTKKLFDTKICGNILFIIGNLCLESYMIQKYFFTDALNFLFPLNIPIIMIEVLVGAYILHIFSEIIIQIFDSKPFDWKVLFLYKK